jgi:hypothetical protein
MRSATRKPFSETKVCPPIVVVIWPRTAPTTAAPEETPIERIRALKLLAAAVSERGTEPMIRAGIAP